MFVDFYEVITYSYCKIETNSVAFFFGAGLKLLYL